MPKDSTVISRIKGKASAQAGIYDIEIFAALIRHERSRADRSGKAFSLVVFPLGDRVTSRSFVKRTCDRLRKTMRSIDEIGWLDEGSVGVLLPSTPSEGARHFARRATVGEAEAQFRIFTYPEHWAPDYKEEHAKSVDEAVVKAPDAFSIAAPAWKRVLDVSVSVFALLLLWPVFLLTAAYIKIVSPGPVLFRQMRVGRGGKLFHFIKFRTMRPNDEAEHRKHILDRMRAGESLAKLDERDPRIIPGGRLIRKLCIDELPQIFNVIRGEMSLVGPRPCVPYEAQEYLIWHRHRFDVLPGMTGLWQVSGKNSLTFAQMIRLDITYSERMSLLFDIKIILMTVPAIAKMVIDGVAKKFRMSGDPRLAENSAS
jgi:lipopolysaccharide/colanic/teichoic acid biosynthesis glycosyltransferase